MSDSVDDVDSTYLQEPDPASPQDEVVNELLSAISDLSQSLRTLQVAVNGAIDRRSNVLPFPRLRHSAD